MHEAAYRWVADTVPLIADLAKKHVLDVGGYDVNGSVRPLFAGCRSYTGLDIRAGPGVDIVADAANWYTNRRWDIVVCCEVLEHAPEWRHIVRTCCTVCTELVIVTCATGARAPHAADGAPALHRGEYYRNVPPVELDDELRLWCDQIDMDITAEDLRARAWR